VFGAASLAFFFLNLATFTSLGVVLYTMAAELHWSFTATGFSFAFLGLACGLSSPLPALMMGRIGGRATICLGAVMLAIGFAICAITHTIVEFYVAMLFIGLGYSLAGNIPGIYLISSWFERGSARVIGLYLMLGALGAAVGPTLVYEVVAQIGWRNQWQVMALVSAALCVICFAVVRDPKGAAAPETILDIDKPVAAAPSLTPTWTPRQAIFTSQFILIACAMAATMACVTTNASVTPNHLVNLGATPERAAHVLSVMAFVATVIKGAAGWLSEKMPPTVIVAGGLALESVGNLALAFADTPTLQYSSMIVFGIGWGFAFVGGTIVVLNFFGGQTGSRILSIVALLTSVAAVGPPAAGAIADRYHTFSPIFVVYAVLLIGLAIPILLMRRPANPAADTARLEHGGLAKTMTAE
jgi:MFS family permease